MPVAPTVSTSAPAVAGSPAAELARALIPGTAPAPAPPVPPGAGAAPEPAGVAQAAPEPVAAAVPSGRRPRAGGRPKVSRRSTTGAGDEQPARAAKPAAPDEHLAPEPRPDRGIFESPPADLVEPEPRPKRRRERRAGARRHRPGKRQATPTMRSFMRWVEHVADGEPFEPTD
jgi:hypothetical protein